jgi:hypothetical protein
MTRRNCHARCGIQVASEILRDLDLQALSDYGILNAMYIAVMGEPSGGEN